MCGLEWAGPTPQPRGSGPGIRQAMQAAEEEIKGQAPIGDIGEVGKGATGMLSTTVGAIPAKDDENGGKGPERQAEAQESENGRRE